MHERPNGLSCICARKCRPSTGSCPLQVWSEYQYFNIPFHYVLAESYSLNGANSSTCNPVCQSTMGMDSVRKFAGSDHVFESQVLS